MKAFLVAVLLAAAPAVAAPPALLTYSGYLQNSAGQPVTTATTLTFSFYAAEASTTKVWQDVVTVTPTSDGWFSVVLGANSANPLLTSDFASELWMGIKASTEAAEMSPRVHLTSTPFALTADWQTLTSKPAVYPPTPHQHAGGDITSKVAAAASADAVPWAGISGMPSTFQPAAHTHPGGDITSKVALAGTADSVPWSGVSGAPSVISAIVGQAPINAATSAGSTTLSIAPSCAGGPSVLSKSGGSWACGPINHAFVSDSPATKAQSAVSPVTVSTPCASKVNVASLPITVPGTGAVNVIGTAMITNAAGSTAIGICCVLSLPTQSSSLNLVLPPAGGAAAVEPFVVSVPVNPGTQSASLDCGLIGSGSATVATQFVAEYFPASL